MSRHQPGCRRTPSTRCGWRESRHVEVALGLGEREAIGHVSKAGNDHLRYPDRGYVTTVVHHRESFADLLQRLVLLLILGEKSGRGPHIAVDHEVDEPAPQLAWRPELNRPQAPRPRGTPRIDGSCRHARSRPHAAADTPQMTRVLGVRRRGRSALLTAIIGRWYSATSGLGDLAAGRPACACRAQRTEGDQWYSAEVGCRLECGRGRAHPGARR